MPIKDLEDYTTEDMNVPEYLADALPQLVARILTLGQTGERHLQGLISALSSYEEKRAHPAYVHLSAEHEAREKAAAHELYSLLMDSVVPAARAMLLAVDPDADVAADA